jgi:hypothetical protein
LGSYFGILGNTHSRSCFTARGDRIDSGVPEQECCCWYSTFYFGWLPCTHSFRQLRRTFIGLVSKIMSTCTTPLFQGPYDCMSKYGLAQKIFLAPLTREGNSGRPRRLRWSLVHPVLRACSKSTSKSIQRQRKPISIRRRVKGTGKRSVRKRSENVKKRIGLK